MIGMNEGLAKPQRENKDISDYRWVQISHTYKAGNVSHENTQVVFVAANDEVVASINVNDTRPVTYTFIGRQFMELEAAKDAVRRAVESGFRQNTEYPY